jgi:NADH-quinone oxidoreductase subunit A
MGQYLPVLALLILAVLFAAVSFIASKLLAPHRPNRAKTVAYESGIVPTREPPQRFPVRFYLVAMLFIMFDIEIIFLYPYAVTHEELGAFGLLEIISFSAVFFAAFVYVVARGALDWGPLHRQVPARHVRSTARTTESTVRRVGLEGREDTAA